MLCQWYFVHFFIMEFQIRGAVHIHGHWPTLLFLVIQDAKARMKQCKNILRVIWMHWLK